MLTIAIGKHHRKHNSKERQGVVAIHKSSSKQQAQKEAEQVQKLSLKTSSPPEDIYHETQSAGERQCTMLAINNALGLKQIRLEDVLSCRDTAEAGLKAAKKEIKNLDIDGLLGKRAGPWEPRLVHDFSTRCNVRSERIKLTALDPTANKLLICERVSCHL
jgi:hypothetical protein